MAKFFIDRPIFAWVVAMFIMIAGVVSITQLPVSQYPTVAPPTITLQVTYPGADAQTIEDSVLSLIEREMNGVENLEYMESKALSNGTGSLTLTFKTGTDSDIAQMDVQNQLARAESRLPAMVRQLGVEVEKSRSNFLLVAMFTSDDPNANTREISDYVARNVVPELQRLDGIGGVNLFGSERAMRVWLDTEKLRGLNLTAADVNNAIMAQNMQISAGSIGDLPNSQGQTISAKVIAPGQLQTTEEFENIVLRASTDGSMVYLKDVARVELGAQSYAASARLNGKPVVGMGVSLSTDGNAIAASKLVNAKLTELQKFFPAGVRWAIPYDSSKFVGLSIEKVVHTLLEAIALVFLVMLLFLQNFRYTIIPTIVVPIALLGALAVVYAVGMSINVLTMFAMVLVIGIVVDDAIVVVENVERIMAEERLPPLEATRKAMSQISSAVVGITVVLISVFIPMAFFSGSTGNIYRQFSVVMAVSIFFSAFMALSLTPALCATLLKPVDKNHHEKTGFFGWFNRVFHKGSKRYETGVAKLLRRGGRMLVIYLILMSVGLFVLLRLPTSFLPAEDQGVVLAVIQLPPGATQARTLETVKTYENFVLKQPEVQDVITVVGFSFSGQGQNMGMSFVPLKDWSERTAAGSDADSLAHRITGAMMGMNRDGTIFALTLPAIPELGSSSGFNFRLQDRGDKGHDALLAARNQLLGMARQSKVLTDVRPDGMEDAPQLRIDIDREAAAAQGVSFTAIGSVLSTALGSNYVNDFPNKGRLQRVVVQGDVSTRMQPEDILRLTVNNQLGQAVPLSSMVKTSWVTGPMQTTRYNGYSAMAITGNAAPGYSSGDAMAEMAKLAEKLPDGFGFEWTGQSREEQESGSQTIILYAFSILAVFLCLAALYESWTIPVAVLLVVPLGFLGAVLGVWGRGLLNDVYFQVGLITVIGLSAKNSILIVEFAKDLQAEGYNAFEAALAAAHLRFRPILMTSLAFIIGVVPLYFASGASSASQRAIGTSVFWGMLIGTFLSVFFVPMFYTAVRSFFHHTKRQNERFAKHAAEAGMTRELGKQYLQEAESSLTDEERRALHEASQRYAKKKDE
ncbi:efflux RND transporter permease subunit [Stenoxybacter acetivorans]|uniref:efflux RND transporter permease subunit n=1 Tax=Stenoxybacter acetivorans TaxID=422441 RepID=UPI0009FD202E|nr:efflux RND transporter permease subunit [Stenoxybacter acetivorans]